MKKVKPKPEQPKYDEKLKINASFIDVIRMAGKKKGVKKDKQ